MNDRKKKPQDLRSARWFAPDDLRAFGHRSRMRQMGLTPEDWADKPMIAVINTWSEANPCHIHLRDRAVATSSPRGTMFGAGPAGHILDPETGMAAPANWRRVSIVHRSAAIADGLSTAGVLQSAAELRAMVTRSPDAEVRAIDQDGNTLVI